MLFSPSYGSRELRAEIRNGPILTLTLASNLMAVSVVRGGSDPDRHLNLEDQLGSAYYFRQTQRCLRGTCKAFLY